MPRQSPNAIVDIAFELDGQRIEATARSGRSALDFLRQVCDQKHIVPGCSPQGLCGCCTVIINGKPRLSCTLRVKNLNGKSIQTLKSFSPDLVKRLQVSFANHGAVQCGYCAPGILLQCAALLSYVPEPSEAMIEKALNMHLCRGSGYGPIKSAVLSLNTPENPAITSPMAVLASVGERTRTADIEYENMHYAVPVFAPQIGTLIGVEEPDYDGKAWYFSSTDVLVQKAPLQIEHGAFPVGFVVAKELEFARELATLFKVEVKAKKTNPKWPKMNNSQFKSSSFKQGISPETVSTTLKVHVTTPFQEPGYLEPDAVVCLPGKDRYQLFVAGVNPHALKKRLMPLTEREIRVESLSCGGSFGGRNCDVIAQAALFLSEAMKVPVSIQLTLEQAQRMQPKSPAQKIDLKLGLDASGKPLSLTGEIAILAGNKPQDLSAQMTKSLCSLYNIKHVNIDVTTHESPHPPTTFLRDKGLTGFTVAMEDLINQAARHTGHDPLSYRARHASKRLERLLGEMARKVVKRMPSEFTVGIGTTVIPVSSTVRLVLKMVAGTGIEIHLPFPDNGQGLEGRLAAHAATLTGFGFDVFSVICSTDVELDGNCGEVDLIPLAIEALNSACSKMCLDLKRETIQDLDGTRWEGVADTKSLETQIAGAVCITNEGKPSVWIFSETRAPNKGTEGLLEGAAHLGLSVALGEKTHFNENVIPNTLLRKLNFLKAKNSPKIETTVIPSNREHGLGAAQIASSAAVCAKARQDNGNVELPLCKSPIARVLGIRDR